MFIHRLCPQVWLCVTMSVNFTTLEKIYNKSEVQKIFD